MPFTTRELKSHMTGKVYAPFASEVEVVRQGHPLLVRYNGEVFPCLEEDLVDHVPGVIEPEKIQPKAKKKKSVNLDKMNKYEREFYLANIDKQK